MRLTRCRAVHTVVIMTRLRHYDDWGTARLVTFSTNHRLPLLMEPGIASCVALEINAARRKYGFRLYGYVIMPEHVHLVLFPVEPVHLGRLVGEIKSRSARESMRILRSADSASLSSLVATRGNRADYAFWLPRCYDHNCRTQEDTIVKINYCHMNPVKRGLVTSPEAWRWSSYGSYMDEARTPIEIDLIEL